MKSARTSTTSSLLGLFVTILLVASFGVEISAKRGCSAFGHSCYGGHGKRSESENMMDADPKIKEDVQLDQNVAIQNGEREALTQILQLLNRQDERFVNSLRERLSPNSWSLMVRKLVALPRHQYPTYSDIRNPY
ncbi:uncharacterized protein LOC106636847 [Copidosoma floridanum]|uniref:uncharacterized protein LOC106636847 n=1 Tax=Copidosoma floridanum TaxID=29053 RepID=UPI0006C99FA4|nr:uncharacterized protein LOC106636847 [Copidosoma floridanum]